MKDTPPKKAPNGQTEGERHKEGDAPRGGGGGPPTEKGHPARMPPQDRGGCPPQEAKNWKIDPATALINSLYISYENGPFLATCGGGPRAEARSCEGYPP